MKDLVAMQMFRKSEGLTLVELLVVIALVGVVASIAFPVISNVITSAQADADASSATASANFQKEYANFNLAQVGPNIVATTDSGDEIARIVGTLDVTTPPAALDLATVLAGRVFADVDGDWSATSFANASWWTGDKALFVWSNSGVDYYAFSDADKGWWSGALAQAPVLNANGSKTWTLLDPTVFGEGASRSAITEYKLSADGTSIVPF